MKLSYSDKQSATWVKVEKYIESEIDSLRQRNDSDIDAVATARLRGQILGLKKILALAAEDEAVEQ